MKNIIILIVLVAFATASFAAVDSTKTAKVKELSSKEYILVSDGDTTLAKAGDTVNVQFMDADSLKSTGKTDIQIIGGKETKIKQVVANGQKFWVKDDQDLSKPIEMICDEDETSDPVSSLAYGLIGLVILAGAWSIWRFVLRG